MKRALIDQSGNALVDDDGNQLIVLTAEPEPVPLPEPGRYVPLNAFTRRTIVRKHR